MKKFVLLLTTIALVQTEHLPSYIKPCKITDEVCIVENGNAAWQKIVLGDKDFDIPVLSPIFELKELRVDLNPNFLLIYTDLKIRSFASFKITAAKYDKEENKLSFTLSNPAFNLDSKYDAKITDFVGQDINGRGDFELNMLNTSSTIDCFLKIVTKESVEYLSLEKVSFDTIPERAYFKFVNLFDGDVIKGKNANQHVDTHWREFLKEVKQVYNTVMGKLVERILNGYVTKVPKSEFFLP